jgi:hypothetical protein
MMHLQLAWFQEYLEHQVEISKTFLVEPHGQDGQLPPGQLPPQVEPVEFKPSLMMVPAMAE